jgi:hypothetical protein
VRRTGVKERACIRTPCQTICYGNQQVCEECKANDLLCKSCEKPHEGAPGTTKYCKVCRSKRRGRPRHPRNPPWTQAEDALLRKIYRESNAKTLGPLLDEHFGSRPKWSVQRRAQTIGAATVRQRHEPWTSEEDALLRDIAWMTPERIATVLRQKGFKRSITAIGIRLKRYELRSAIDGLSASGLADMLDVDSHLVVRWIQNGWLQSERAGTTGDNHDRWHITTGAVRSFLRAHPEQYELSKIERAGSKMWFLDLITGGIIPEDGETLPGIALSYATGESLADRTVMLYGERMTLTALADVSGRSVPTLLRRIDGRGMSVE